MIVIDADALIQKVKKEEEERHLNKGNASSLQFLIDEYAKPVNAILVIRCKDCKHFDGYYCHNEWWGDGHGNYTPPIKTEDGFCDWAENGKER